MTVHGILADFMKDNKSECSVLSEIELVVILYVSLLVREGAYSITHGDGRSFFLQTCTWVYIMLSIPFKT